MILLLAVAAGAQSGTSSAPNIRPKSERRPVSSSRDSGPIQPDVDVIDAPTTGVLDYGGYSSRSRFYANGGILEYISFGAYPGLSLGASSSVDGVIGGERDVRMRAPTAQVKYRFYEGDSQMPSLAIGFDGQGYGYNIDTRRFNQRQRGLFVVATKEIGLPGLLIHPSFNISDFDSNGVFGCLPLTLNIKDKASILLEWDNIADWSRSRFNAGLRAHVISNFNIDFAVRSIGTGGWYSDGSSRGPERIVQLKYSGSF
ncbi:MAG: hypothetical protein A2506_01580 [Elusimicrobia bacterium RIFOXYD12_FULL_66_9]|nr:MAG: hypothetical protein A2506_01580 [Elusimicrobia bacterium RIFOXYD12_FULL_66_9]